MAFISGSKKLKEMGEDRISSLPDNILHHILSFVDMKYAVPTCVLSTRWRYLWTSLPFLNFKLFSTLGGEKKDFKFMNFIDQVLILRDKFDIQRFRFSYDGYEGLLDQRFNSWIIAAVRGNIQELDLKLNAFQQFKFPNCLFTCTSLEVLNLSMEECDGYQSLLLPGSVSLPRLKTLSLGSLCFVDEELTNKLFSGCPILESLTMYSCRLDLLRELIISAPHLKQLQIKDCSDYEEGWPDNCYIKVYAPKLATFTFINNEDVRYHLESCTALNNADIEACMPQYMKYDECKTSSKAGEMKEYVHLAIELFRAVASVKALTLSNCPLIQYLLKPPTISEVLPLQFTNLSYLMLKTKITRNSIRSMMHLLNMCPNIGTFCLDLFKGHPIPIHPWQHKIKSSKGSIEDHWEVNSSSKLHNLKVIKVQNVCGCFNELVVLTVLLENALTLEKLYIFNSFNHPFTERRRIEFSEKLSIIPRASSRLTIFFI